MNFAPHELQTAHNRLNDLRKQAAKARQARAAKASRQA